MGILADDRSELEEGQYYSWQKHGFFNTRIENNGSYGKMESKKDTHLTFLMYVP